MLGGFHFRLKQPHRASENLSSNLRTSMRSASSISTLQTALEQNAVKGIDIEQRRVLRGKATAKTRYANAAAAVGKLAQDSREKGTIGFKQAKRAIQSIVDLMMSDEASLLGLTTLRCHDQYTHNHSVNVSLLSMALGNRAGYPKVELADLGLAALFHDLGKTNIPMEVLNKPGEFTDDEWKMMRNHPTEGVLGLTSMRSITTLPGRMTAASFEHHMNLDFSGYPKLNAPWKLSMTGRILMIADCYDAMTSSTSLPTRTDLPVKSTWIYVWENRKILRPHLDETLHDLRWNHSDRQSCSARYERTCRRAEASRRSSRCGTSLCQDHLGLERDCHRQWP